MIQAKDYSKKTHSAYYEVFVYGDAWRVRVYAYAGGLLTDESGKGSPEKFIKAEMAKHKLKQGSEDPRGN